MITALLGACIDVEVVSVAHEEQAVESSNRILLNGLSSSLSSLSRMSTSQIALNRLGFTELVANPELVADFQTSKEGRDLLAYFAKCALPEGLDLVVTDDDQSTVLASFPGLLGLAPEWENRPPTLSEQRWVSACLLAQVNAFGASVPVSLRGPHSALRASKLERTSYVVKEAAFFGNIFQDVDGDDLADLQMYGCDGNVLPHHTGSSYLEDRVCGNPDPNNPGYTECGFVAAGSCFRRPEVTEWACEQPGGIKGAYKSCYTSPGSRESGWPSSAERYDEVITVYLLAD